VQPSSVNQALLNYDPMNRNGKRFFPEKGRNEKKEMEKERDMERVRDDLY